MTAYKNRDLVDFQVVKPGYVTTAMTNYKQGWLCCKASETAQGSLSDLGN